MTVDRKRYETKGVWWKRLYGRRRERERERHTHTHTQN